MQKRLNILVCYYAFAYPTRDSIMDHVYCYERYSAHRVFFHNVCSYHWDKYNEIFPAHLASLKWDIVIFHNTLLICRAMPTMFDRIRMLLEPLRHDKSIKIVIAQDEHNCTDALCSFINDFHIQHVFTEAPTAKEVEIIYKGHIDSSVGMTYCLAGYVEERHLSSIGQFTRDGTRDIDIGYRSFRAKARNGRAGVLKYRISDLIAEKAPSHGLKVDVSVDEKNIIAGSAWFKFLARSRYQAGVEGGSSIIDRTGELGDSCREYESRHPDATFEEIEAACFPGRDGSFNYVVISPRVFECAMAKCCQILVEGHYNGIIEPNVHYIPIKKDFSDLDEVLGSLHDEERRQRIAERAYQDLIQSGRYNYRQFVAMFFREIASLLPSQPREGALHSTAAYWINRAYQKINWLKLANTKRINNAYNLLPANMIFRTLQLHRLQRIANGLSPRILFMVDCNPERVYRIQIEAATLARHSQLQVRGLNIAGTVSQKQPDEYLEVLIPLRGLQLELKNAMHNLLLFSLYYRRFLLFSCVLFLSLFGSLFLLALKTYRLIKRAYKRQYPRFQRILTRITGKNTHSLGIPNIRAIITDFIKRKGLIRLKNILKMITIRSCAQFNYWCAHPLRPDLIYNKDMSILPAAILIGYFTRTKIVHACYEFFPYSFVPMLSPLALKILKTIESQLMKFPTYIITVSPQMVEEISHHYPAVRDKIGWIPNVDVWPDYLQSIRHAADLYAEARGRMIFFYQGFFTADRGIDALISAWQHIDAEKAVLFLRGSNNKERDTAIAIAEKYGLLNKSIYFLPAIDEVREPLKQSLEHIAGADICFIPYDPECVNFRNCSPRKLSHYLLAGKMVITSNLPYAEQIVREANCGLSYKYQDNNELIKAIQHCIDHPTMVKTCKENALRFAREKFHWKQYEPVFEQQILSCI